MGLSCHDDRVTGEIIPKVTHPLLRLRFAAVLVHFNDDYLFSTPEKRYCIADGSTGFARILPGYHDSLRVKSLNPVGYQQNRTTHANNRRAWIERIVCVL